MFCFNEFSFTVQVEHKINSTQILGFILICLYFTTGHFHTCVVLCKECSLCPFQFLAQFSATVSSFMGILFARNINVRKQAINDILQGTVATCVGSRAYNIICHLNCRKVPSLNLSRTSTVCLTSPILTLHKSVKFR